MVASAVITELVEPTRGARTIELAPDAQSVPMARRLVRNDLRHSDVLPGVIDSALIIITELVSNSIVHAQPVRRNGSMVGVVVRWTVAGDHVLVDVTDGGGPDLPRLKPHSPTDAAGRGMTIVDHLADSWTVEEQPGAVTVHAVVSG